jgi:hypothetical protein
VSIISRSFTCDVTGLGSVNCFLYEFYGVRPCNICVRINGKCMKRQMQYDDQGKKIDNKL